MKDIATLSTALEYAKNNKIEEWVHLFLNGEGNNVPFSEGLKLEKRQFLGPINLPLNLFKRCCGPEEELKYQIDEVGFERNVMGIMNRLEKGWDMPPLIINYEQGNFELNDGNHRFEALIRKNILEYSVILWTSNNEDLLSLQKLLGY